MKITIIAAMDYKLGIGKEGEIPWNIPEELNHFKEETMGHPVIMGRKTFENILDRNQRPLPGRENIVLTSDKNYNLPDTVVARNKEAALEAAKDSHKDEVYIAGGESVYEDFLLCADRAIISKMRDVYDCDTHFPVYPNFIWKVISVRDEYEEFEVVEYEAR